MPHNMVYGGLGKFGWSWLKERVHMPWFSIPAPTCICGITQYTYCQRSRRGLQDGVSLDRRIPKTCECVCVCCFMYESVVWSVVHVLGVIFLCGRRHLFLAIFLSSVHEALRLNCLPALPSQRGQIPAGVYSARLTIQFVLIVSYTWYKQHHFLFVFSRLPSLCCVLCVLFCWSFGLLMCCIF